MATINLSTVLARNTDMPVHMYISYTFGYLTVYSITRIEFMHNLGSLLH